MATDEVPQPTCPSCGTPNKPGSANCRTCGTRFREPRRSKPSEPVLLQRVMTGELFEARLGGVPKPLLAEDAAKRGKLRAQAEELERYRRRLLEMEGHLRERARSLEEPGAPPRERERPPPAAAAPEVGRPGPRGPTSRSGEETPPILTDRIADLLREEGALEARIQEKRRELATLELEVQARAASESRRLDEVLARQDEAEGTLHSLQEQITVSAGESRISLADPVVAGLLEIEGPEHREPQALVPTFVQGFDEALGGGIPGGSVVVLAGASGTLKSSLALSILLGNAEAHGARGVYVTLEESGPSLLRQADSLGLETGTVARRVRILDAAAQVDGGGSAWLDHLREGVEAIRASSGCDLLVIDSLEALEARADLKDRRREMFRFFEWLRSLEATTFVVAERPDIFVNNAVILGRWDEDFLADGVLHLRMHVTETEVQRRIRCVKMRRARHDPSYYALLVDGGRFVATRPLGG